MIKALTHHTVNGIDVAVTSVSSEAYIGDFALLVHKLKDMQNLEVILEVRH
jgi:tRNA nucleotidyltransferase (CCA-adding enzyme)